MEKRSDDDDKSGKKPNDAGGGGEGGGEKKAQGGGDRDVSPSKMDFSSKMGIIGQRLLLRSPEGQKQIKKAERDARMAAKKRQAVEEMEPAERRKEDEEAARRKRASKARLERESQEEETAQKPPAGGTIGAGPPVPAPTLAAASGTTRQQSAPRGPPADTTHLVPAQIAAKIAAQAAAQLAAQFGQPGASISSGASEQERVLQMFFDQRNLEGDRHDRRSRAGTDRTGQAHQTTMQALVQIHHQTMQTIRTEGVQESAFSQSEANGLGGIAQLALSP